MKWNNLLIEILYLCSSGGIWSIFFSATSYFLLLTNIVLIPHTFWWWNTPQIQIIPGFVNGRYLQGETRSDSAVGWKQSESEVARSDAKSCLVVTDCWGCNKGNLFLELAFITHHYPYTEACSDPHRYEALSESKKRISFTAIILCEISDRQPGCKVELLGSMKHSFPFNAECCCD